MQASDIILDNGSGKRNTSKYRLLADNAIDSSSDFGYKSSDNTKNSLSIFFRDSGGGSTTISIGGLDERFKSLFLGVNGKGTGITRSTSEGIDLFMSILC